MHTLWTYKGDCLGIKRRLARGNRREWWRANLLKVHDMLEQKCHYEAHDFVQWICTKEMQAVMVAKVAIAASGITRHTVLTIATCGAARWTVLTVLVLASVIRLLYSELLKQTLFAMIRLVIRFSWFGAVWHIPVSAGGSAGTAWSQRGLTYMLMLGRPTGPGSLQRLECFPCGLSPSRRHTQGRDGNLMWEPP